jgi:hypothetical protein
VKWRESLFLALSFLISVVLLVVIHLGCVPPWLRSLPAAPASDGILWQVQTTFLSVGFAGLAIAAQLFAETPLAIGASRGRVLGHVWAGRFVGFGLVANAVIGIETIWLPSDLGVLFITTLWFVPTVVLLVLSSVRLMRLFGHPSLLDEVVRSSLVNVLGERLEAVARRYASARDELEDLFPLGTAMGVATSTVSLRVPVPRCGLVIKSVKLHVVRWAMTTVAPQVTESAASDSEEGALYEPPQVTLTVEPGDRTRLGETAFRVTTSQSLDAAAQGRLIRGLQSSIEFESPGFVTPDEETDREIANLKDAVGTSLRAGAYGTAERAMELLGDIVRGVWTARPESLTSSRRSSFTRRGWLFRSIGEAEQDVLLSPRAAGLFVSQAMTRAVEAPRAGSPEYVDECLRSFTRIWYDILRYGTPEFETIPSRITVCVQNLAAFSYSAADQSEDLQARATWTMVELVKLAIDANKPEGARAVARELQGLFEYSDPGGGRRAHVRAGQLVLAGWLDYLAGTHDPRSPGDAELRALVTPRGRWREILEARTLAERGEAPFSRWDLWEIETSTSGRAQVLQLSSYIDRAELAALALSLGPLPAANDQDLASTYRRFINILDEGDRTLTPQENSLRQRLAEEVGKWEAAEDDRLADEPLSDERLSALKAALRESLNTEQRLAATIPIVDHVPATLENPQPILGMNFRVPRHYLLDRVFNQTYADPEDLGRMIARGFADGEERKIVDLLRSEEDAVSPPTARAIRQQIEAAGDDAAHYVLVSPYGGLIDIDEWFSTDFQQSLTRVTHVETAALEEEAILFDRRTALASCRRPEEKDGLAPVEGTTIALGVFEDVQWEGEPQVRIETGEFFIVWRNEPRGIFRFASAETATPDDWEAGDTA